MTLLHAVAVVLLTGCRANDREPPPKRQPAIAAPSALVPLPLPPQSVADWVVPVGEHRLVTLDARNATLNLVDSTGRVVAQFGSKGRGPGEWVAPSAAVAGSDGTVIVLDPPTAQLLRITVRQDALQLKEVQPVPVNPQSACVSAGRLLVMANLPEGLVHRIDARGAIVQSFGRARSDDPSRGDLSALGSLACDSMAVVAVNSVFGTLHRFELASGRVDSSAIPDFQGTRFVVQNGRMSPTPPPGGGGVEMVQGALPATAGTVVRVERRGPDPSAAGESRTLLYSWATSTWSLAERSTPAIVGGRGEQLIFRESEPDGDRLLTARASSLFPERRP